MAGRRVDLAHHAALFVCIAATSGRIITPLENLPIMRGGPESSYNGEANVQKNFGPNGRFRLQFSGF